MRRQGRVAGRVAAGVVLAALALPAPARAELAPPVAALLAACLDAGLTPAHRLAAARAAGWADLPAPARGAAARALAPWDLLRMAGAERLEALEADHLARDLAGRADHLAMIAGAGVGGDHWLTLPEGGPVGRILDARGTGAASECEISAPITAEAAARALGLPARRLGGPRLQLTLFDLPAAPTDRGAIVTHVAMTAPEGWPEIVPILITPLMPRPVRAP